MSDGTIVYARYRRSGKVHKRASIGKGFASHEADNLDAAGAYDDVTDLSDVDENDLCKRCFADGPDQPDEDQVPSDSPNP